MKILETQNLTHEYTPGTGAVDINLEINEGEIVGFIGPNGAGKTTTIKMLMGLISPDKGKIFFKENEINSLGEFTQIYKKIGFCPSSPAVYEELSALEMFKIKAALHSNPEIIKTAEKYSKKLDLDINKRIKSLSMGNRQKVSFILSVIGNPELIIMDEPTTGMDPLIRLKSLQIVNEVSQKQTGIFLSSHNLSEVEAVCDRIIIIKKAEIIYNGTVDQIKRQMEKKIKFEIKNEKELKEILKDIKVKNSQQFDNSVTIITPDTTTVIKRLLDKGIEDFTVERPSLEEAFIDYYNPNE